MKSKLFIENNTIKDISNLLFKRFKNNILLESSRKKHNQSINSYSFNDVSNYDITVLKIQQIKKEYKISKTK